MKSSCHFDFNHSVLLCPNVYSTASVSVINLRHEFHGKHSCCPNCCSGVTAMLPRTGHPTVACSLPLECLWWSCLIMTTFLYWYRNGNSSIVTAVRNFVHLATGFSRFEQTRHLTHSTRNYKWYSTLVNLLTLQFTVIHIHTQRSQFH
jgi:hypothetical protein